MRAAIRLAALLVGAASLLIPAAPAGAHDPDEENHPGFYEPSPESKSPNLDIIGSAPRTNPSPTYRNSDLAFWGNLAFAGHYEGFRVVDLSNPRHPRVVTDVSCPGVQHDVSVWQGLLFLSIDAPLTAPECGSPRAAAGQPGFEGLRIFDVRDPANPRYVGAVATDCGSHTHTLVPDYRNPRRVLIYVSSYPASELATSSYGNTCTRQGEGHSKISVVEVPLKAPAKARVIAEPRFELNDYDGVPGFRGCHDIQVFTGLRMAAGACMSEGQIWDIRNIERPRTVARIHNPNVEFFHSAAFTYDGSTVLFGDEAGGGTQPRCRTQDPTTLGAIWIYDVPSLDVRDSTTVEPALSHYKIPRVQGDVARCTMHNFNVLPTFRRYVAVSAAYSGGTTVFDFTNRRRPREIAHNDPHGANTWSSYWYNGLIVTNDTGRGTDVMALRHRVRARALHLPYLNPQTQEWPLGRWSRRP